MTTDAVSEAAPTTTEAKTPEKPKLTVRSAASIMLVVVGGLTAVGLLAFGGWIAAAAVPVATSTGLYARHRMKNPRKTGGNSLWPFNRRTHSRNGTSTRKLAGGSSGRAGFPKLSNSRSRKGTNGRRTGGLSTSSLVPKTTRSRARAGAGGVLPKHKASRSVPSRITARQGPSAGVRPKGTRTPKTPSKTPSRPSHRPSLVSGMRTARRSRSSRSALPSILGPSSGNRRGASPKRSGTRTRKGFPLFRTSKGSSSNGIRNRRNPGKVSRPGRTMRQRLNPFKRTSPSGKHSTARNPWKRTKPMNRTGNPNRMRKRDRVPRRTPSRPRPRPYKRMRARSLWRLAFGIPVRGGKRGRLQRPTTTQRRRARRTLRLRSLTRLWAVRRIPGRALRWHWDRIFSKIPGAINPEWLKPTAESDPPKPPTPTPPSGPGLATVIPINRKETFDIMSDGPHGVIAEAFNQLAQFEPQTAGEWERFLASQQELFSGMGQAYNTLAERARSGMAFNAQTSEALQDLAAAVASLQDMAEQSHQAFGFNQ